MVTPPSAGTAIEPVTVPGRAPPGGHYSAAIGHGDLLFVSGQLPVAADGSHRLAQAGFADQARQVLANLCAVLAAGGSAPDRVLKLTVFIADLADWPAYDALHAEAFGAHRPARSVVPTGPLHYGYRIEIEAIAAR